MRCNRLMSVLEASFVNPSATELSASAATAGTAPLTSEGSSCEESP